MNSGVRALLWKETRQIPRKRSATLSAFLFPLLFFVVLPLANVVGLKSGLSNGPIGMNVPAGVGNLSGDYAQMLREVMPPLFIALGGLVIPSITATYTIVGERERRTIELLVALPVSLGQIVLAKLLAVLLLGAAVAVPLFLIDAGVMLALDVVSVGELLELLFLLVAALLYSTASALVVGLLAADYRTANNLNGALLGPIILLTMAALMLLPAGVPGPLVLGGGFLVLAGILTAVGLRAVTVERFLR